MVLTILVPQVQKEDVYKDIVEKTNGAAGLDWGEDVVYASVDNDVLVF